MTAAGRSCDSASMTRVFVAGAPEPLIAPDGASLLQVLQYFYNPILQIIIWTHLVYITTYLL